MARWLPAKGYAGRSAGSILKKKVTSTCHFVSSSLQYRCANKGILLSLLKVVFVKDCDVQCLVVMQL
jgi:hypothetical protein